MFCAARPCHQRRCNLGNDILVRACHRLLR
jgi:hypothetical protein